MFSSYMYVSCHVCAALIKNSPTKFVLLKKVASGRVELWAELWAGHVSVPDVGNLAAIDIILLATIDRIEQWSNRHTCMIPPLPHCITYSE